jgi:DNA (cytosine-5)-methyltransferase 1
MTKFSRLSRFGMTYKPLTESRGEELLTLYLEDFHARTLAQPAKAQELKETNPQCGNTWQGSLARLDPSTFLWRTAQCSLLEDLEQSLQTFPTWGSMQNGALYQLPMLVQTISVREFGSEPNNETFFHTPNTTGLDGGSNSRKALKKRMWLTPTANEDAAGKPGSKMQKMLGNDPDVRQDPNGGVLNPTWVEWLMGWPPGFTDLKPLVMDKSLYVQQLHGSCLNE